MKVFIIIIASFVPVIFGLFLGFSYGYSWGSQGLGSIMVIPTIISAAIALISCIGTLTGDL